MGEIHEHIGAARVIDQGVAEEQGARLAVVPRNHRIIVEDCCNF